MTERKETVSSNPSEEASSGYSLGDKALRALPCRVFSIISVLDEAFEHLRRPVKSQAGMSVAHAVLERVGRY